MELPRLRHKAGGLNAQGCPWHPGGLGPGLAAWCWVLGTWLRLTFSSLPQSCKTAPTQYVFRTAFLCLLTASSCHLLQQICCIFP